VPDVCTVFGANTVDWFRRWGGYPVRRVVVTGGLRQDRLVERYGSAETVRPHSRRVTIRAALRWPSDRPVVLLCTAFWRDVASHFELTTVGCRSLDFAPHVAVKLHPLHPASEAVHQTARELGVTDYSVFAEGQVYDMIHAADLLVTCTSTVIVESELLGTPSVVIAAHRNYPLHHSRNVLGSGTSTATHTERTVSNLEEMETALHRFFRHGRTEGQAGTFAEPSMANVRGIAWENLFRIIQEFDATPEGDGLRSIEGKDGYFACQDPEFRRSE